MIKITESFLEPYLKGQKKHAAYEVTVDIADHLKFHFDGYVYKETKRQGERENPYFTTLIDVRRPSESDHIKEYRRKIYLPITKQPCFKVLNSLKKIVKSPDWNINWSKSKLANKVREGEQLEDYCDKKLPFFKSVENWFYSYGLKELLSDPNGLISVLPIAFELSPTDFRKPYPYFVPSENVFEYIENELAIYKSSKTYEYKSEDGKETYKDYLIYVVTKTEIWEARYKNTKKDIEVKLVHNITFGKLPVFRAGGTFKEIIDNSAVYDSFVSPILPGLDAAARELSDLDAEVVQHIFTTMWYYASQGCATCNGTGKVIKHGSQPVKCTTCDGNGVLTKSPYKDLVVKAPEMGEQALKPPFAGYIEKNTEIVKIQDKRIDNHIYKALSSLNMEFLAQVPQNQSGKAKEVDRDELNSFVYGIAYHSVEGIIKEAYFLINEFRLMDQNITEEERRSYLPQIAIPERFEILSENYLQEQVAAAKTGQINPLIVNSLEIEFVNKKFENYPEIRDRIKTIIELDPFPSMTPEQKDNAVMAGTIIKEDAILSNYIGSFVERAISEDEEFLQKDYSEKMKTVKGYAAEVIKVAEEAQRKKEEENRKLLMKEIDDESRKAA